MNAIDDAWRWLCKINPWRKQPSVYDHPFPPQEDNERILLYERYRKLYESKHQEVYSVKGGYKHDPTRPWLTYNILGELTRLVVDRQFGEPVTIKAPEVKLDEDPIEGLEGATDVAAEATPDPTQAFIDHLEEENELQTLFQEIATGTSYRGDGVARVFYDEGPEGSDKPGEIRVRAVQPASYFPTYVNGNLTEAKRAWIICKPDKKGAKLFLQEEIHTPGLIEHRLYKLHGEPGKDAGHNGDRDRVPLSTLEETADLPDEQPTGVDAILLVHMALSSTDEPEIWGTSDYEAADSLQGEVDNRETQRGETLDAHANPRMFGPRGWLNEDNELPNSEDYLEIKPGDVVQPGYLTWDGSLGASSDQLKDLRNAIAMVSGISPESLRINDTGGPESGRAIKLKEHRTTSKVRRRHKPFRAFIQAIVSLSTKLYNSAEVTGQWQPESGGDVVSLEAREVKVDFGDGVPNDDQEQVETEATRVGAELSSRLASIMRLDDVPKEEAQKTLDQIAKEKKATAPPRMGLSAGFAPLPGAIAATRSETPEGVDEAQTVEEVEATP